MTAQSARGATAADGGRMETAEAVWRKLSDKRIVLDCRWLGRGGAGTATASLLRELTAAPPPGEWTFWGDPSRLNALNQQGARIVAGRTDPHAFVGQRDFARVPSGDIVLYMHQIRPLRPGRTLTVIHDTIPLRHGGSLFARAAKRAFFLLSAHMSNRVLTVSHDARRRIERDLRVRRDRIDVVAWPVDVARATRVVALRSSLPAEPVLLYVGRFAPHKNLERLCAAFARSHFASQGGRLLLVGAWSGEASLLRRVVTRLAPAAIELRPACSDGELDRLLATSRALVLPSLEEGFGLPAFEAVAAGLPVAVSNTGAMAELPAHVATKLDPHSVDDIRRAIDDVTTRSPGEPQAFGGRDLRGAVLASLAACFSQVQG